MDTNDYQIGGSHYQRNYQHWDFVCDTGVHYLIGCATKYVSRWRDKNGVEDLRKSLHYISKAQDENIRWYVHPKWWEKLLFGKGEDIIKLSSLNKFCMQHNYLESEIIRHIVMSDYHEATIMINELILQTTEGETQ